MGTKNLDQYDCSLYDTSGTLTDRKWMTLPEAVAARASGLVVKYWYKCVFHEHRFESATPPREPDEFFDKPLWCPYCDEEADAYTKYQIDAELYDLARQMTYDDLDD
jgi:hypothetical protein